MRNAFVLVALLVTLAASARGAEDEEDDEHTPAAERETFTLADGFDVQLFASEDDGVVKPIQIRFDARGRLWVVGSSIYPQIEAGQAPNDKILVLEDTDHDGRADKTTVFADGLTIPTGIEIGDGGVYVGHNTQLLHLKDTDGDGKADTRRVVLSGFGTGDTHQNINSFSWGPGGELHFCQGLSIRSRVETPWGIVNLNKAGLWRLYPRRLKLEPFYGGEAEPQNPWGWVFTEWGEPIVLAGNNHSHNYPAPGMVPHTRQVAPHFIWAKGAGRKCSGGAFVGNAHFPRSWQGALLLGGYLNNAVWALKLSDDGAGFLLEDREQPLISSSSPSFRPVDVKFGPDGALYVCDWYNTIIGHYQNSFWDPRRDKSRGRIWRITAKNRKLTEPPKLVGAPIAQILDNLKSSDNWTRHFSKRVLADLPTGEVTSALKGWTAQDELSDRDLVEALGVYQSHEVVELELLARLCRASNPGARAYAASVIGAWADRLPDPLAMLRPLVADESSRVRLRATVSCAWVPSQQAVEVALIAADHPTDKFLDYALNQVIFSQRPQWVAPLKAGKLNFENKPARVAALVKADGTADTLRALRDLVASPQLDPAARENFLRILADVGDANDLALIVNLKDLDQQSRLLPAIAEAAELRNVRPAGDLAATVRELLAKPHDGVRAGALRLASAWKLQELADQVKALAIDAATPAQVRLAAVTALPAVMGDSAQDVLTTLGGRPADAQLRAAAIGALSTLDVEAACGLAAALLNESVPDAAVESVFRAILKRSDASASLSKALGTKKPTPDAAKIGLRVMSATGEHDEALSAALQSAAGLNAEPKGLSESELKSLVEEVKTQGDPARGAEVFLRNEMSCAVCHAVNGKGGRIGPDLGSLGTAQTVEFIVGAILEPNRDVKEGYVSFELATKSGERYQAYILSEDNDQLTIRDIAQDKQIRLRKDAIKRRVQRGSVMPPGLVDTLTRAEFRDMVSYLASLGHAK